MSYVFKAILLVILLACAVMAETFKLGMRGNKSLIKSLGHSAAIGSGFLLYAGIEFVVFVPGAINLIS